MQVSTGHSLECVVAVDDASVEEGQDGSDVGNVSQKEDDAKVVDGDECAVTLLASRVSESVPVSFGRSRLAIHL